MTVASSEPSTSISIQVESRDKSKQCDDDSPFNDGCFFFAKKKQSNRCFSLFKCSLCIIYTLAFIFEMTLCTLFVKYYLDIVQDLRDMSIFPPRTSIQVESAHAHFFLINAILLGPTILVALAGVIRENLIILAGYSWAHSVITGFQVISAWQSYDLQLAIKTGFMVAPSPFLIIFGLIFAHLCRKNERKFVKSQAFKRFIANKSGKGETMSHIESINNNVPFTYTNTAGQFNDEAV